MSTLTAVAFILLLWHSAFLRIKLVKHQKHILLLSDTLLRVSKIVRDRSLKEFEDKLSVLANQLKDKEQ